MYVYTYIYLNTYTRDARATGGGPPRYRRRASVTAEARDIGLVCVAPPHVYCPCVNMNQDNTIL